MAFKCKIDQFGVLMGGPRRGDYQEELTCTLCGKRYWYVYKNGSSTGSSRQKCNSCHANASRFTKKDQMIAYKGGKCQICGYHR